MCTISRSIMFCLLLYLTSANTLWGQQERVLTYDETVRIALGQSFTVKSYQEEKNSVLHYFRFRQAMFRPRMDFTLFAPQWNENVISVQRADGLPVYNSFGSMQTGGNVQFTYPLPTGGNFALRTLMYRDNQISTLALQDYTQLKNNQAYTSLSLSFSQPLFTRNTLDENLDEARYQLERTSSVFTREQMNIIYNVTNEFYRVYRATRNVEIAREKLSHSEESLRIAQLLAKSGRIPEGDVLISEVDNATNQADLSQAINELERRKDDLKQLIGLDLSEKISIVTDLVYDTVTVDLQNAIHSALENRLELKESDYAIKLQQIELDRARRIRELSGEITAYYDITGVSTLGTGTTDELFQSSFNNINDRPPNRGVTFTLSYPIFDWGRGRERVQQETATLRQQELTKENLRVTIIKEVRDVVRSVKEAQNRLEIHKRNQDVAQRSYQISRIRFENGDISSQDLSRQQERLAQARLDYLDAYITYQLSLADLKRKTLWDFENSRSYLREDFFTINQ